MRTRPELQIGFHPEVARERLGHSSMAITLDTYSHVAPYMQSTAAAKIDAGMRVACGIEPGDGSLIRARRGETANAAVPRLDESSFVTSAVLVRDAQRRHSGPTLTGASGLRAGTIRLALPP